jgi:hypothetical protein
MTKEQVFRLWALEIMVSMQGAALHANTSDPQASLKRFGERLMTALRRQAVPGLEPVVSDHASAELEDALNRLLSQQQRYLTVVAKPSE